MKASQKKAIRNDLSEKRNKLSREEHLYKSTTIVNTLINTLSRNLLNTFAGYLAVYNEVDLRDLYTHIFNYSEGLLLPVYRNGNYLFAEVENGFSEVIGAHRMPEPGNYNRVLSIEESSKMVTHWLVPLVAFDQNLYRLGYGGGYYDRFLENAKGLKIGIAFDFQEVDSLPIEDHDIPLDMIITETRIIGGKTDI